MRDIIFRGLRTDGKGWLYGDLYHGLNGCVYINTVVKTSDTSSENVRIEVIPETVGQYTGLTDKNGLYIYEGNRLRHLRKYNIGHISVCSVVFRNGGFFLFYGNLIYEHAELINRTDYTFEIIGNIHEPKTETT